MNTYRVRSRVSVGLHRLVFTEGLSESVEVFVETMATLHPDLFPLARPVLVGWGEAPAGMARSPGFSCAPVENNGEQCLLLEVGWEGWWFSPAEEREIYFVLTMLITQLREAGRLQIDLSRGLRMQWEEREVRGTAAAELLEEIAAELVETRRGEGPLDAAVAQAGEQLRP